RGLAVAAPRAAALDSTGVAEYVLPTSSNWTPGSHITSRRRHLRSRDSPGRRELAVAMPPASCPEITGVAQCVLPTSSTWTPGLGLRGQIPQPARSLLVPQTQRPRRHETCR